MLARILLDTTFVGLPMLPHVPHFRESLTGAAGLLQRFIAMLSEDPFRKN
jgi:hypothetical protein